jgi:hypothetical protein
MTLSAKILSKAFNLKSSNRRNIIGIKISGDKGYVATNCERFNGNYERYPIENLYGIYHDELFTIMLAPTIEDYSDIYCINNKNAIVKTTSKSKIYLVEDELKV